MTEARLRGLVLAAGAGSRLGRPKALVRDLDGTSWLQRSVAALVEGGCDDVTVVLGAAPEAAGLLGPSVTVVEAPDWASGMSASLRAGLAALGWGEACVVTLVDLTDVDAAVVRRVVAGAGPTTLARAAYDGVPGHPVVLGREHWAGVVDTAAGDEGARGYLATRDVALVECGDLATGADVDHAPPGPAPPNR